MLIGLFQLVTVSISMGATYPIGIGDECPEKGTFEVVLNTDKWADSCFSRTTGRKPIADQHESDRLFRDMDLDGTEELLEVRGTGSSSKTIFVFRSTIDGFVYIGALNAHPQFQIEKAEDGAIEYIYFHGTGLNEGTLMFIRYIDDQYVTVRQEAVP